VILIIELKKRKSSTLCLYTPLYYPFVYDLQNSLNKNIDQVFVYTTGTFGNYPTWSQIDNNINIIDYYDIFAERLPKISLYFQIMRQKPDFIVLSGTETIGSMLLIFLARIKRIPTLLMVEENKNIRKYFPLIPRFMGFLKMSLIKIIHKNADILFPETDAAKNYLREMGCQQNDITVSPHGLNLSRYQYIKPNNNFLKKIGLKNDKLKSKLLILYVGGLYIRKGIKIIINLFENKMLDDNMLLFVTGVKDKIRNTQKNSKMKSSLEYRDRYLPVLDIAERKKLLNFEQMLLLPYLSDKEMLKLLSLVDIVIVPSVFHKDTERSPNIIIEAMAMGKLVIGSDMGGIPTMIGEGGILVPEGDAKAIADVFKKINNNRKILKDYEGRARKHAKEVLNSDVHAELIIKQFDEFMKSKKEIYEEGQ
jgi:glycosyltransferase involved in cell wall biosynthesis